MGKMEKKVIMRKVLGCFLVFVILMSAVPVSVFAVNDTAKSTDKLNIASLIPSSSSNTVSGTFELLRNGYNDIGPKHKYLDCGGNVNYFDISVLFNWEDSGVERLKIDASTGGSFESGLYPTACGEDVFILDSTCGKITLNYDGLKSDSDGWHYKYSYTIEESDSKPSLAISVWTDKFEYKIGETVTMYYKTNKKCTAKLTITKPDGGKVVYGPNEIPACTRSKSPTAGYPTGKRTVVFEAWAGSESKKATCYFDVVEEKKPDLIVSSINFNPNSANKYDDVIVSVTVMNRGKGDAGPHYEFLGYPDRYTILKEWYCSGLKAGASKTFTHRLENVQHSDTYEACADWRQAVQESDGTNNCLTAHLEVKESEEKPNLIVESILPDVPNPKKGETITFTVKTKNIGSGDAEESFYIYYYIDGDKKGSYYVSGGLDADKTKTTYFSWEADQCGKVQMKAWVDRDNDVVESNDWDNTKTKEVNVECPEDAVEKYALIIGINEYDSPDVKDLKFAENDAVAFYNLLVYGYGYPPDIDSTDNVELLTKYAQKSDIEDELGEFQNKVDANDIFVFYFSGHGFRNDLGEEHIRASDYDISSYDLDLEFDKFDGTVICIFDACHSGGMTLDTDINTPSRTKYGIDRDNAVVLMACEADNTAGSKESVEHALFTNYLYKAFVSDRKASNIDQIGDPNRVSVEEAFIYADKQNYKGIILWPPSFHDQDPQMMDHYLTKSDPAAHCYLAEHPIDPEFIAGKGNCPIHLHAYDSEGRHTGMNAAGDGIEEKIPGSFYNGPEYDPEEIIVLGKYDDIIYKIEALDADKFNFTITKSTETETKRITYLDVPITETTVATVDVSEANPTYTMEIDDDGDGITDATTSPDSIETIGCTYDHDGDGIVEDDIDDLIMATDAYLGFNTGIEYDADGDGIVEDDIDDLIMATDAYLGFITCEGEER